MLYSYFGYLSSVSALFESLMLSWYGFCSLSNEFCCCWSLNRTCLFPELALELSCLLFLLFDEFFRDLDPALDRLLLLLRLTDDFFLDFKILRYPLPLFADTEDSYCLLFCDFELLFMLKLIDC